LGGASTVSTNITISDNIINTSTLDDSHRFFGIIFNSGTSNVKIFNNTLYGQGIWIDDQSLADASSHDIQDNKINGEDILYYKNIDGLNLDGIEDVGQILLVNCHFCHISNLDVSFSGIGVSLYYSDQNYILNCNSSQQEINLGARYSSGVYLYNSDKNVINNLFISNSTTGILLEENSDFNTISENELLGIDYVGINIQANSNNNTLSHNYIDERTYWGVQIRAESIGNIVSDNLICSIKGIDVSADSNQILSNTLIHNSGGIQVSGKENLIEGNDIKECNIGIYMTSQSSDNLIILNNFLNNYKHASDDGINNEWNNTLIGNFWDDYVGLDIDDNGIGDSPYLISGDANSQDNYPIWEDGIDPPNIIIASPNPDAIFGLTAPSFDVDITDDNPINETWYSIDDGMTNFTFTGSIGVINQTAWDLISNGSCVITFFANDTAGSIGNSSVMVWKDSFEPNITINSPSFNQLCGIKSPALTLTINEPHFQNLWYSLNGGNNVSFISQYEIDQFEWDKCGNGTVIIRLYASDTVGNIGFSQVIVRKDSIEPVILINNPLDAQKFGSNPPQFNLSIIEETLVTCWYQIEGDENQYEFTGLIGVINEDLWNALPKGLVHVTFYAQDEAGNLGSASVNLVKNVPNEIGIGGYHTFLFVMILGGTVAFLLRKSLLKFKKIQ
jgi:parallel beta-helix repeat protein